VGTAYIPGLAVNGDKHLLPGQDHDAIEGRHPNKTVNVGFVGGNVARKQADELFVEKRLDGYNNKSPLWTPD
jgi:prepilin-type processing-associated H-X9-DG protein